MWSSHRERFSRLEYLDYFDDLGKHPIVAGDVIWFESGRCFYQSFPFHVVHGAGDVAVDEVFDHRRVLAARFAQTPKDHPQSRHRSVLWIRTAPYSISDVSSNSRSKIRRGLRSARVEQISFADVLRMGVPLAASTARRQRVVFGDRHATAWRRMCTVAERHPLLEAWGTFIGGALAAFAICFRVEDCFQISTVRSDSALLGSYPNNALIHTLLEEGFTRCGVRSVCYGLASLDRGTKGLDDFKQSAGFEAVNVDDVIVGRLPVLSARVAGVALERVAPRSHRLGQLATIAQSVSWWRRY